MTQETRGMWLGAIGVAVFSLTLPFTRIAVAELNPVLVALGRAVVAAAGSALLMCRCSRCLSVSFFGYKGLALGGTARVGQVQLLQPFLTLLGAFLILGEALEARNMLFALAVVVVVAVGRRMSIRR